MGNASEKHRIWRTFAQVQVMNEWSTRMSCLASREGKAQSLTYKEREGLSESPSLQIKLRLVSATPSQTPCTALSSLKGEEKILNGSI